MAEPSLKSLNMKWLVMLAGFDVVVVGLFIVPELLQETELSSATIVRGMATLVLPVVVLLITGVMPHDLKAKLVYWKFSNALPSCAAFTKYGPSDSRIDMQALRNNWGALPTAAAEQNSLWYKMYQGVKGETAVAEAHKSYLLFRDMAAISIVLTILVPIGLWWWAGAATGRWSTAAFFLLQYWICAVAAQNSGKRFVCNVMAIQAAK